MNEELQEIQQKRSNGEELTALEEQREKTLIYIEKTNNSRIE